MAKMKLVRFPCGVCIDIDRIVLIQDEEAVKLPEGTLVPGCSVDLETASGTVTVELDMTGEDAFRFIQTFIPT
jgi:hypothetical protein